MPRVAAGVVHKKTKKKPVAPNIGKLRGRGAYTYENPGPWGRIGSAAGGMIGSALGSSYGLSKPASQIGKKLGSYLHYIGKIFGSGDYVTASDGVRSNSLMHSNQIPSFASNKNEVRIRHREYLGDVYSASVAGAFQIQSFAINPGLSNVFPWLSQVCGATFQQHRINGMVYEFRSMSADALNSTNTALGSVVMATDYDSKDNVFTSKQQMENTMFGVSCKPSSCMLHAIECARSQTSVSELYIRAGAVPSGADIRLYDLGRFSIATQGCQGTNVNLGELWVSYDITLIKQIEQPPGFLIPYASYLLASASETAPLGLTQPLYNVLNTADKIGLTFASQNRVEFPFDIPVGTSYFFSISCVALNAAVFTKPVITCGNGMYFDINVNLIVPETGVNTVTWTFNIAIQYKGGGTVASPPYVNVANYTWAPESGIVDASLIVTQVSANFAGSFTATTA